MFTVTRNGSNRLDIELGGKLDSEAMKFALDDLLAKAEGIENGKMLYRIRDFDFPSIGALAVEFSRLPKLFGLIRHFDRVAVVCGQSWLRSASEIEGAFIPGMEIKAFEPGDETAAEAWLAR